MIDLEYPKDIVFENRLSILLTRNNIKYDWTPKGISVHVGSDLEKANSLIEYLKVNNKPV